jgi:hypothetical protein
MEVLIMPLVKSTFRHAFRWRARQAGAPTAKPRPKAQQNVQKPLLNGGNANYAPRQVTKQPMAFRKNIKAEVKAGKPVKQAVAIAYSVKRAAAKKKK